MKRRLTKEQEKIINKRYLIVKIVFMLTPFLAYLYITLLALQTKSSFQEVLLQPQVTIAFIQAMMTPYIAYLLHLSLNKLLKGEMKFVCINLVLLTISCLLNLNIVYICLMLYLGYSTQKICHISIIEEIKNIGLKNSFNHGGGSMILIALSSLCFITTIRIM